MSVSFSRFAEALLLLLFVLFMVECCIEMISNVKSTFAHSILSRYFNMPIVQGWRPTIAVQAPAEPQGISRTNIQNLNHLCDNDSANRVVDAPATNT